tara:strand:- start:191 stop:451 length:261 start_codon:yes stop_codon:yes gene_type:complete
MRLFHLSFVSLAASLQLPNPLPISIVEKTANQITSIKISPKLEILAPTSSSELSRAIVARYSVFIQNKVSASFAIQNTNFTTTLPK